MDSDCFLFEICHHLLLCFWWQIPRGRALFFMVCGISKSLMGSRAACMESFVARFALTRQQSWETGTPQARHLCQPWLRDLPWNPGLLGFLVCEISLLMGVLSLGFPQTLFCLWSQSWAHAMSPPHTRGKHWLNCVEKPTSAWLYLGSWFCFVSANNGDEDHSTVNAFYLSEHEGCIMSLFVLTGGSLNLPRGARESEGVVSTNPSTLWGMTPKFSLQSGPGSLSWSPTEILLTEISSSDPVPSGDE